MSMAMAMLMMDVDAGGRMTGWTQMGQGVCKWSSALTVCDGPQKKAGESELPLCNTVPTHVLQ